MLFSKLLILLQFIIILHSQVTNFRKKKKRKGLEKYLKSNNIGFRKIEAHWKVGK